MKVKSEKPHQPNIINTSVFPTNYHKYIKNTDLLNVRINELKEHIKNKANRGSKTQIAECFSKLNMEDLGLFFIIYKNGKVISNEIGVESSDLSKALISFKKLSITEIYKIIRLEVSNLLNGVNQSLSNNVFSETTEILASNHQMKQKLDKKEIDLHQMNKEDELLKSIGIDLKENANLEYKNKLGEYIVRKMSQSLFKSFLRKKLKVNEKLINSLYYKVYFYFLNTEYHPKIFPNKKTLIRAFKCFNIDFEEGNNDPGYSATLASKVKDELDEEKINQKSKSIVSIYAFLKKYDPKGNYTRAIRRFFKDDPKSMDILKKYFQIHFLKKTRNINSLQETNNISGNSIETISSSCLEKNKIDYDQYMLSISNFIPSAALPLPNIYPPKNQADQPILNYSVNTFQAPLPRTTAYVPWSNEDQRFSDLRNFPFLNMYNSSISLKNYNIPTAPLNPSISRISSPINHIDSPSIFFSYTPKNNATNQVNHQTTHDYLYNLPVRSDFNLQESNSQNVTPFEHLYSTPYMPNFFTNPTNVQNSTICNSPVANNSNIFWFQKNSLQPEIKTLNENNKNYNVNTNPQYKK